jgi:transposase
MFYCGIDVAKHSHTVIVIDDKGKIVEPALEVTNDQKGLNRLDQLLSTYRDQLRIGLEATGHYWLALYERLSHLDYSLSVLNPMQVRAYRKIDLRKRKTDRKDAFWIADFMRFFNPKPTDQDIPLILRLRELSRFRFWLTQQIGDCKRKIISILDRVFPEYEHIFSNVFLQSSRALLQNAITAEDFADFDLHELESILSRTSRGRFGEEKARQIHETASQSIGVTFLADAIHIEMSCLLNQIALLEEQQSLIDIKLENLMNQIPQFITSIPGVGLTTGAMLLAEIGDIHRFESPEKLVAYAGIDPSVFITGQFEGDKMHMSKRGSHYLRYALWQAACSSLLHNSELKSFYDKKRAEGKPHKVALGAVCNKLIKRIYVVLKENRPYVLS